MDQGYNIEFLLNSCIIRELQTRAILGKGLKIQGKGLYQLNAHSISSSEICTIEQPLEIEKTLLWHRRLGHLNFDALHKLSLQQTVTGLP
jgi:hypothetical protein